MQIDPSYIPYLRGEKFSAALSMRIAEGSGNLGERVAYLEQISTGKRVLHVGCLDHLELIASRIALGTWLHKRLTDVAEVCLGIDIDVPAAAEAAKHGFDNVVICDLLLDEPDPRILAEHWDYIILGEVLEHMDNPVAFLQTLKEKYGAVFDRIIITVPNAFHLDNIIQGFRHVERINTDHRFWFTPYTLARVATAAGLEVLDVKLCLHKPNVPRRRIFYRAITWLFPLFRGNVIMELLPANPSQ